MLRGALPFLLVVVMLAPGCVSSPWTFEMTAREALIIDGGYRYEGGSNVVEAQSGRLEVQLDTDADTGLVYARVEDGFGLVYETWFDQFSGSAPYHDGGVHQAFYEHGDTGNGTTELPTFWAYVAAWGTANATRDGVTIVEPTTRSERFSAHLMVVRGQIRDPVTHRITKADGSTPYDPATPTDARFASDAGAQAILQLKTVEEPVRIFLHFQFNNVTISRF